MIVVCQLSFFNDQPRNYLQFLPGGYSWEFLVGMCCPILQFLTLFLTKKCESFFTSVFRLGLKDFFKIHFEYADFSFLLTHLGLKRYICSYTLVVPSKTIPDSRPKWAKTMQKNGAKYLPFGAAHTYVAYIRKQPPGSFNLSFLVIKSERHKDFPPRSYIYGPYLQLLYVYAAILASVKNNCQDVDDT